MSYALMSAAASLVLCQAEQLMNLLFDFVVDLGLPFLSFHFIFLDRRLQFLAAF